MKRHVGSEWSEGNSWSLSEVNEWKTRGLCWRLINGVHLTLLEIIGILLILLEITGGQRGLSEIHERNTTDVCWRLIEKR